MIYNNQRMNPTMADFFRLSRANQSLGKSWESAQTTRLNAHHWGNASDESINEYLSDRLPTLRARCAYEASNNPMVEGVINTYANDVVGRDGPKLQIMCDDAMWAKDVEQLWHEWWEMPDMRGQMSGVDMLRQWQRLRWIAGEYLLSLHSAGANGEIKIKLINIHPRRLASPMGNTPNTFMGIQYDDSGKPLFYFIEDEYSKSLLKTAGKYRKLPADRIIHRFEHLEPDQARGVPLLASVLDTVADLREWDQGVIQQIKMCAAFTGMMVAERQTGGVPVDFTEAMNVPIEVGTMGAVPPGWTLETLTPSQPTAEYNEFFKLQHAKLGRPVGMPGMMVHLDSQNHNYSSARFDGQVYNRGLRITRANEEKATLNRLVKKVVEEGITTKRIKAPSSNWSLYWIWESMPHVDPLKEAEASSERLHNGTGNLIDEIAAIGGDFEENIAKQARVKETYESYGLQMPTIDSKSKDNEPRNGDSKDDNTS